MARVVLGLSAFSLGLLSGAMLFIAVSLMTAWQAMEPRDFSSWFGAHSERIAALMLPLGFIPVLLGLAGVALAWRTTARPWAATAALCAIAIVVLYPVFFASANARFAAGGLPEAETRNLLGQWATWHWCRTMLGLVGFAASLVAFGNFATQGLPQRR